MQILLHSFKTHRSQLRVIMHSSLSDGKFRAPSSEISVVSADNMLPNFVSVRASSSDGLSNVLANESFHSFPAKMNGRMNSSCASNLIDSYRVIRYKSKSEH